MVGLSREFINSWKAKTIVSSPVANGLVTTTNDLLKRDLMNFLLAIMFAVDSIHMEDVTRTGNDVTRITMELPK
jgi:hypothetical protein